MSGVLQPIATAPKDRPILAWCTEPSPAVYGTEEEQCYDFHKCSFSPISEGFNVVQWIPEDVTGDDFEPAWWFLRDDWNETPAWPVLWMEIPTRHAVEVALAGVAA